MAEIYSGLVGPVKGPSAEVSVDRGILYIKRLHAGSGLEVFRPRDVRHLILSDSEGGRFLVDAIKQCVGGAEILRAVTGFCLEYYNGLLDDFRNGDFELGIGKRKADALLERFEGIEIKAENPSLIPLIKDVILAYGLNQAREAIVESFALNEDQIYLQKMGSFLEVLVSEIDLVTECFGKESSFYYSVIYSWRIKSSKSCLFNPEYAYIRDEIQASFSNFWGQLAASVEVPSWDWSFQNYLGPGGGTGKSTIIWISSFIDEKVGLRPWIHAEEASILEALGTVRDSAWRRIEHDLAILAQNDVDLFGEADSDITASMTRNFGIYMDARSLLAADCLEEYMFMLKKLSYQERTLSVGYGETMGLACANSIMARAYFNKLLEANSDFMEMLHNEAVIFIPDHLRMQAEYVIYQFRDFVSMIQTALERTGRPIIFLDMPVSEAIERSGGERGEFRGRHDLDRPALRFLAHVCREILPQDIAVVHCGINVNGAIHYLSRIQVACACDLASAGLNISMILGSSQDNFELVKEHLVRLKKRVCSMQVNLDYIHGTFQQKE